MSGAQHSAVTRAERACLVALASLPGVGPASVLACRIAGNSEEVWARVRRGAKVDLPAGSGVGRAATEAARLLDPEAVLARHEAFGLDIRLYGEVGFPGRLVDDPAPPGLVFSQGDMALCERPTVAIVGTRNATAIGCEMARTLARGLGECGVSVVSGLALGIDGAAHQALIDLRADAANRPRFGAPIGVVASGFDRPYPRRHRLLHTLVASHGLLLSEVPLGGQPLPWRFPARNRLVAGLADAVVVVESRSAGGSMSTVAEALARDVPVLAVPGHPLSAGSAGGNDLIADGAAPVRDIEDVLVAIGLGGTYRPGPTPEVSPTASIDDDIGRSIISVLGGGPASLARVVATSGRTILEVSKALDSLELDGRVERAGSWFQLTGRASQIATGPRR